MFISPQTSPHFFNPLHGTSSSRPRPTKERCLVELLDKLPNLKFPENRKTLNHYRVTTLKAVFKNPAAFSKLARVIGSSHLETHKDSFTLLFNLIVLQTVFRNTSLIEKYNFQVLSGSGKDSTRPLTKLFVLICNVCFDRGLLTSPPSPMPEILNDFQLKVYLDKVYLSVLARDTKNEPAPKRFHVVEPTPEQLALLEIVKHNPISKTALTKLVDTLRYGESIDLPDGRMVNYHNTFFDSDIPTKNPYEIFFNLMLMMKNEDTVDVGYAQKLDKLEVCVQAMRYNPSLPFSYVKTCELINGNAILDITSVDKTTLLGEYKRKDLALRAVECELKIPESFNMLADCLEDDEEVYVPCYGRSFTKRDLYMESRKLDPDNIEANGAIALIDIIHFASLTAISQ